MDRILEIGRRFPLKLLLAVTAISLVVGQFHPFSRFPMYSSFPPQADLYYLADGEGNPLPALPTVGIFGPELKQRIEHQYESYGVERGQESYLMQAADSVLRHLATERSAMLEEGGIRALSIRKVVLTRREGQLHKEEREVAAWP